MKITAGILFLALISNSLLSAKEESISTINKKISTTEKNLKKQSNKQKKIKKTINQLAKNIIKARKELKGLERDQKRLEREITHLSKDSAAKQKEVKSLEKEKNLLVKERQNTEIRLIELLTKNISKSLVLDKLENVTTEDIIRREIFSKLKEQTNKEIKKLKDDFLVAHRRVEKLGNKIDYLSRSLKDLNKKRARVAQLKTKSKRALAALNKKQDRYSNKLADIISRKKKSRDLLANLGIIKSKALKKVQAREERDRLARVKKQKYRNTKRSNTKVKKHGSSYLAVGKNHYRGRKVKPPIDDKSTFTVTKKFGPFVDPIYDIKIHNDYVTLHSDNKDAVVRNVLNGKVVFADELPMLGKVVIIEHRNDMHTIYRKLNQISPNVRVKSKIRSREAIGRIEQDLEFEVTKDSIPINPLELIRVPRKYITAL